MSDPADLEELRYAVRRYLAARPLAACTLEMIVHGLRRTGLTAQPKEVEAQLAYWTGTEPPQLKCHVVKHGSSKSWQITSAGTVADERGE